MSKPFDCQIEDHGGQNHEYVFGHPFTYDENDIPRFCDNGEAIEFDSNERLLNNRVCPRCELPQTEKGQDPCISDLPGVKQACCGHGILSYMNPGSILFEDETKIVFGVPFQITNKKKKVDIVFELSC